MFQLNEIEFSTDKSRLDICLIHTVLKQAYWSKQIPLAVVQQAIENSFCMAAYLGQQQIGFARLITDYATFAYLADVFVLDAYQGQGVGKALVQQMMATAQPWHLRRMLLATHDAHLLYEQYGFKMLAKPENFMEIVKPDIYLNLRPKTTSS